MRCTKYYGLKHTRQEVKGYRSFWRRKNKGSIMQGQGHDIGKPPSPTYHADPWTGYKDMVDGAPALRLYG